MLEQLLNSGSQRIREVLLKSLHPQGVPRTQQILEEIKLRVLHVVGKQQLLPDQSLPQLLTAHHTPFILQHAFQKLYQLVCLPNVRGVVREPQQEIDHPRPHLLAGRNLRIDLLEQRSLPSLHASCKDLLRKV